MAISKKIIEKQFGQMTTEVEEAEVPVSLPESPDEGGEQSSEE